MDIIDWFKNATLAVKIITGALILIILLLILSIISGSKPKKTQIVTNNSGGKDFEEIPIETPTLAPTIAIPTVVPTSEPTPIPTDTPQPTIIPTLTPYPTDTPTPTNTNPPQPVVRATNTPIPTIYPEVLHLSAYKVELYPGEQQEIRASILPPGVFDNTITWTIENSNIARIENAKNRLIITAASPGSTKIIAKTINDKTAEVLISIKETATKSVASNPTSIPIPTRVVIEPTSIHINRSSLSLSENDTTQLTVTYIPSTTTRRHLNWSSSNINVVTVDVSGKVTAVNPGTAVITATSVNGQTSRSTITVTGNAISRISIPTQIPTSIPTQIPTVIPTQIPTPITITTIVVPDGINLSATSANFTLVKSKRYLLQLFPQMLPTNHYNGPVIILLWLLLTV